MKVKNEVHAYQINGQDTKVGNEKLVVVTNVWNKEKFVNIQIDGSEIATVLAADLHKAIINATDNH